MEDYDFYPPKPELVEEKPKSGLSLTIFSLVLFVMVFLFIAGDAINLILQLVIVLLIHELGHFITMKMFGYRNVRMLFIPLMGAFVQGSKSHYSLRESFIVTAAGPFPGVFIGTALVFAAGEFQSPWIMSLGLIFVLINIVNLLPLDPLDGGQMFKMFFRWNHELFLMIFAFISSISMIGVGFWLFLYEVDFASLLIVFGFIMGFRVRAMQKKYQMHKELKEEEVNYSTTYKLLSNKDFGKIKRVVLQHTPALERFIDEVSSEEADPIIASQVNSVLITPMEQDASLLLKLIILLLWIASFTVPFLIIYWIDLTWFLS